MEAPRDPHGAADSSPPTSPATTRRRAAVALALQSAASPSASPPARSRASDELMDAGDLRSLLVRRSPPRSRRIPRRRRRRSRSRSPSSSRSPSRGQRRSRSRSRSRSQSRRRLSHRSSSDRPRSRSRSPSPARPTASSHGPTQPSHGLQRLSDIASLAVDVPRPPEGIGASTRRNNTVRSGSTKVYWHGYHYTQSGSTSVKTTYRCSFYRRGCPGQLKYLTATMDFDYANHTPHTCGIRITPKEGIPPYKPTGRQRHDVTDLMEREIDRLAISQNQTPLGVWEIVSSMFLARTEHAVKGVGRSETIKRFYDTREQRGLSCDRVPKPKTPAYPVQPIRQEAQETTGAQAPHTGQKIRFVDDIEAFPLHAAVYRSQGQLASFREQFEANVSDADEPMATMAMQFSAVTTSHESLCAAEYAYYLGYREVGDFLAARMPSNAVEGETDGLSKIPAQSVRLIEPTDDFAYVCVVDESKGDVEECELLCELFHEADHAVDARIQAEVTRERGEAVYWSAVEYASHLGFVEIVKYLLKEKCRAMAAKDKIQLLRQTQERQRQVAPSSHAREQVAAPVRTTRTSNDPDGLVECCI